MTIPLLVLVACLCLVLALRVRRGRSSRTRCQSDQYSVQVELIHAKDGTRKWRTEFTSNRVAEAKQVMLLLEEAQHSGELAFMLETHTDWQPRGIRIHRQAGRDREPRGSRPMTMPVDAVAAAELG